MAATNVGLLVTLAVIVRTDSNMPIERLRSASDAVRGVGHRRSVNSAASATLQAGRVGHRRSVSSSASATPIGAQLPPHKNMQPRRRSCTPKWT